VPGCDRSDGGEAAAEWIRRRLKNGAVEAGEVGFEQDEDDRFWTKEVEVMFAGEGEEEGLTVLGRV
jgi:hypothetical protein